MARETGIRAVLFDVGGVLTVPLRETLDIIAARGVVDVADAGRQFRETFIGGHDGDDPSHKLERGEMSMNDFLATLGDSQHAVWQLLHPDSPDSLHNNMTSHSGMHQLVDEARVAGYKTAIVSNIFNEYLVRWDEITNHVGRFDSVVYSCVIGMRKPNRAIFDFTLGALDVKADEAVLIDDSPEVIKAAAAIGLRTIRVDDHDEAIASARRLLNIPNH